MSQKCKCPFCDTELLMRCFEPIFCTTCNIELIACPECNKLFNIKFEKCPHCGTINKKRSKNAALGRTSKKRNKKNL